MLQKGSRGNDVLGLQTALNLENCNAGEEDGIFGDKTEAALKKFQRENDLTADGIFGPNTKEKFKLKQYKSGGMANFTGPAWLDGSKSKPEYVLNAEQTKAFFTLVDVLSSLKAAPVQNTQNSGEYHYDIDINVETIENDYDVEQMSKKIEEMIVNSSQYRNNNVL